MTSTQRRQHSLFTVSCHRNWIRNGQISFFFLRKNINTYKIESGKKNSIKQQQNKINKSTFQMDHVIRHEPIPRRLYLVRCHPNRYHIPIFVRHRIAHRQIVTNIDAIRWKFGNMRTLNIPAFPNVKWVSGFCISFFNAFGNNLKWIVVHYYFYCVLKMDFNFECTVWLEWYYIRKKINQNEPVGEHIMLIIIAVFKCIYINHSRVFENWFWNSTVFGSLFDKCRGKCR